MAVSSFVRCLVYALTPGRWRRLVGFDYADHYDVAALKLAIHPATLFGSFNPSTDDVQIDLATDVQIDLAAFSEEHETRYQNVASARPAKTGASSFTTISKQSAMGLPFPVDCLTGLRGESKS